MYSLFPEGCVPMCGDGEREDVRSVHLFSRYTNWKDYSSSFLRCHCYELKSVVCL